MINRAPFKKHESAPFKNRDMNLHGIIKKSATFENRALQIHGISAYIYD